MFLVRRYSINLSNVALVSSSCLVVSFSLFFFGINRRNFLHDSFGSTGKKSVFRLEHEVDRTSLKSKSKSSSIAVDASSSGKKEEIFRWFCIRVQSVVDFLPCPEPWKFFHIKNLCNFWPSFEFSNQILGLSTILKDHPILRMYSEDHIERL